MLANKAQLEWHDNQPYSAFYGDVYFSSDCGIDETEYVFLKHNQLAERWRSLTINVFTIAETGFGTGLNFLCAWDLWKKTAPASANLHFVSLEKHPLTKHELAKALNLWPSVSEFSQALIEAYDDMSSGWHRLVFDGGRVTLTLLIGDAVTSLSQLKASVDAWFLDGFSPAKNPDMWLPELFQAMAKRSHETSTFATFTSAGQVKRGLQAVGFDVRKASGFGKKREMLYGRYLNLAQSSDNIACKKAIVIGGGIAGTSSAEALARRGWQVNLIERHHALATQGSGNPLGVLYPRLIGGETPINILALHGFLYTLSLLKRIKLDKTDYAQCGVLQLAFNDREQQRLDKIKNEYGNLIQKVNAQSASEISGINVDKDGVFIPSAGWLNPPAFCLALSQHRNIQMSLRTEALKLIKSGENWQVWHQQTLIDEAPVLVLASASDTQAFVQTSHCELSFVRGQISLLPTTEISQSLKTVICTDGYLSPARFGQHCLGATFSPNDSSIAIRAEDHASNLAMLRILAPELADSYQVNQLQGRAAIRCTTADYLPMAGAVLDSAQIKAKPPRYNATPNNLPWLTGLYVNTGHGAKGLINAPLCAEIIASLICNEPSPVPVQLLSALDPNRFLLKAMGLKGLAKTIQHQSIAKA